MIQCSKLSSLFTLPGSVPRLHFLYANGTSAHQAFPDSSQSPAHGSALTQLCQICPLLSPLCCSSASGPSHSHQNSCSSGLTSPPTSELPLLPTLLPTVIFLKYKSDYVSYLSIYGLQNNVQNPEHGSQGPWQHGPQTSFCFHLLPLPQTHSVILATPEYSLHTP